MKKARRQMSDEAFELIASRFRVLAEPMRLKILHSLEPGEMTVSGLVEATGGTQANISKHLGILLESHFVARRKEGLNAWYRLHDDSVFYLCDAVCNSLDKRLTAQQSAMKGFSRR
jgi:DNA-binding transcriptional ArsR family regulator